MNGNTQQPPRRHTVLLVDDDERILRLLARLLQWADEWKLVGTAADGSSALACAEALHPELVLLDLWMHNSSSLHLLPQLRALQPPPLVVILTGDQAPALRDEALALGASAYLDKLMDPADLLAELRTLWD